MSKHEDKDKSNALRDAMLGIQGRTEVQPATVSPSHPPAPQARVASTRVGKRAVTGFISHEAYVQLHHLALDRSCSIQALLEEAFNDLFRKHEKSAIV